MKTNNVFPGMIFGALIGVTCVLMSINEHVKHFDDQVSYQMHKDSIFDANLKQSSAAAQAEAQHTADSLKQDSLVRVQALAMQKAQDKADSIRYSIIKNYVHKKMSVNTSASDLLTSDIQMLVAKMGPHIEDSAIGYIIAKSQHDCDSIKAYLPQ
jgi:hypothetical protein